jgi:CheY-like chemotaxis protein
VLERHGCTVLEARHGHEALTVWEQRGDTVDLLITDVVMPGMGGPELASVLRAARPELPVVFMSGYAEEQEEIRAMTTAGAGFLAKPFELAALGAAVREALARTALARTALAGTAGAART